MVRCGLLVLLCTALHAGLSFPLPAQLIGSPLPAATVHTLEGTPAEFFEDFRGTAVLIEFFAYW